MDARLKYFITSTQKLILGKGKSCPNCGVNKKIIVDRKYLVTVLNRCHNCKLLFRTPTTSQQENSSFYQEEYTQGFTTDMPDNAQLKIYFEKGFPINYLPYIEIVKAATEVNQRKLFEFGCSWGYGSYQFKKNGFEVESYEISKPRASYASEKLELKVHPELSSVKGTFDIFFSSHVLEHVPSVQDAIDFGFKILKPGGLFIAATPNGSNGFRKIQPKLWATLWNRVHPNFLDDEYYKCTFAKLPFYLTSIPYLSNEKQDSNFLNEIYKWKRDPSQIINNTGLHDELLIIVKK